MNKRNKFREYIALLILSMMVWYTRSTMLCDIDDKGVTSFAGWLAFVVCFFGSFFYFIDKENNTSSLSRFLVGYVIWMLIDLYVFGNKGGGLADGFRVCFGPMCFLLFFFLAKTSQRVDTYCCIIFTVIMLLAAYYNIINVQKILFFSNRENTISNLVYWVLCSFPFVFLIHKQWIRISLFSVLFLIVILTGKRSALVSVSLIALLWYFFSKENSKRNIKRIIGALMIISALVYVSMHYLSFFSSVLFGKMASMADDQGSGRIPLYNDVLAYMQSFDFIDWLFGKGMGSITLTRHTNAHNDALQMLFEFGIIGLILYIVLFVKLLKRCLLIREYDSELYLGYVSCFIIFIVLGLVSNLVVFYSYFSFLCIYWGMAEGRMCREYGI